MLSSVTLFIKI